jgi:glycoside/pentoside/hexuronide:cation symporter, GPH family
MDKGAKAITRGPFVPQDYARLSGGKSMQNEKVPQSTKMIYGLSCSANNLHIHFDTFFLTYFLTDVFGLSAAFIGVMYLFTRLFDAINDPIEGFIIDHTKTRWGRFRAYLLLVPIPFALIRVLLYSGLDLQGWTKSAFVLVLYVIGGSATSFIAIALNALLSTMTKNTQERNSLSGWYVSLGLVTTLIVSSATKPLVDLFPTEQMGFFTIVLIFSTIATLIYFLVFIKVRENYEVKQNDYPLKQIFKMVVKNKPLLILCLSNLFAMAINVTVISAAIYYFKYLVGREDLYGLYMLTIMGMVVLSSALTPRLANRLGKKKVYAIANLISMVGALLIFFTPSQNLLFIFLFSGLLGIGSAPPFVLLFSMGADTVEYGEMVSGTRAAGLTMSMIGLTIKASGALAGAVVAFLLSATKYIPNAVQTPLALFGIRSQMTLVPFIFALLALVFIQLYKLDQKEHLRIIALIQQKQEANPEQKPDYASKVI